MGYCVIGVEGLKAWIGDDVDNWLKAMEGKENNLNVSLCY